MTAATARRPRVSELDFQRQLVGPHGIATMLGWLHVHFRPAMTTRGWRTPGTGELAKGWPDLVLVRARDHRLIFAELKADDATTSPQQRAVLDTLSSVTCAPTSTRAGPEPTVEVHVWRPRDLDSIAEILR